MSVHFRLLYLSWCFEGRERERGRIFFLGGGGWGGCYKILYKYAGINEAADPCQNFWFQRIRLPAVEEEAIRRFDVVRPRESREESSVHPTSDGALDVKGYILI